MCEEELISYSSWCTGTIQRCRDYYTVSVTRVPHKEY